MLQAVKRRVWAAVVGEMKSSNTSAEGDSTDSKWLVIADAQASNQRSKKKKKKTLLTELHADVLIGILLPQLFIGVCVAHEREDHVLNDALQSKSRQSLAGLPRLLLVV